MVTLPSRRAFAAVWLVGAISIAAALSLHPPPASPPPPTATRAMRAFSLHDARPTLSPAEVADLLDASDRVRRELHAAGVADVGDEIQRRMRDLDVTEADRLAFYEASGDLFGGRSYARSRMVADRLIRVRAARADLAGR